MDGKAMLNSGANTFLLAYTFCLTTSLRYFSFLHGVLLSSVSGEGI